MVGCVDNGADRRPLGLRPGPRVPTVIFRAGDPGRAARFRLDVNSRIYAIDAYPDTPFLHAVRNDLEVNNLRCLWACAVRRSHGVRRWAARALLHYAGFGNGSCQTCDAATSALQRIHTLSRRLQGAGAAMQRLMHQWPDHNSHDGRLSRSQPAVIFLIIAGAIFMVAIFGQELRLGLAQSRSATRLLCHGAQILSMVYANTMRIGARGT
jgi:hypothetical protein